jgi:TolB-like protein
LEVIVSELCETELKRPRKTEPLQGIIEKLKKENFIPENIAITMISLNSLSNLGTHPKDLDPEQIKPTLNNLAIILKWYQKYKDASDPNIKNPEEDIKIERFKNQKKYSFKLLKRHYFPFALVILFVIIIVFQKSIKRLIGGFSDSNGKMVIAVMPFKNMTNDTLWNVWQEGIQINLISALTNTIDFKVRQLELTNNFLKRKGVSNLAALTPDIAAIISQKLETGLYIYGNILKSGSVIQLNAQLIDSKTREGVKSFQLEEIPLENNILNLIDSLSIMIKNYLLISKLEKGNKQFKSSSTLPTNSPEAYRYYILGKKALLNTDPFNGIQNFMEAVKIDSNFYDAYGYISLAFYNLADFPQAKFWMEKYYSKRDLLDFKDKISADYLKALLNGTPNERIRYLEQLQYIDDLDPGNYVGLGFNYSELYQYDKAILNFEKALNIFNKWDSIPIVYIYYGLASSYQKGGQYRKAEKLYKMTQKRFPDDLFLIGMYAILAFSERDTILGINWVKTYISKVNEQSMSATNI